MFQRQDATIKLCLDEAELCCTRWKLFVKTQFTFTCPCFNNLVYVLLTFDSLFFSTFKLFCVCFLLIRSHKNRQAHSTLWTTLLINSSTITCPTPLSKILSPCKQAHLSADQTLVLMPYLLHGFKGTAKDAGRPQWKSNSSTVARQSGRQKSDAERRHKLSANDANQIKSNYYEINHP